MIKRPDIFVEWELQGSQRFLHEAVQHFDARLTEVDDDGYRSEGLLTPMEEMHSARRLVLESVVYQLNAILDAFLHACAPGAAAVDEVATAAALEKRLRRSRSQLVKDIEDQHSFNVSDLAGWGEVDWLRETANALKHRGGTLGFSNHPVGIPLHEGVQLDVQRLVQSMQGVRAWTTALSGRIRSRCP